MKTECRRSCNCLSSGKRLHVGVQIKKNVVWLLAGIVNSARHKRFSWSQKSAWPLTYSSHYTIWQQLEENRQWNMKLMCGNLLKSPFRSISMYVIFFLIHKDWVIQGLEANGHENSDQKVFHNSVRTWFIAPGPCLKKELGDKTVGLCYEVACLCCIV